MFVLLIEVIPNNMKLACINSITKTGAKNFSFYLHESYLVQKPLQHCVHSSCSDVPVEQRQPLGLLPNLAKQLLSEEEASQAENILLLTGTASPALVKVGPIPQSEVL